MGRCPEEAEGSEVRVSALKITSRTSSVPFFTSLFQKRRMQNPADLNVIDFDKLRVEAPVMKWDLPAGGKRLLQKARGYRATFVSGAVTYRDGEATGALPGRLVRGPQTA